MTTFPHDLEVPCRPRAVPACPGRNASQSPSPPPHPLSPSPSSRARPPTRRLQLLQRLGCSAAASANSTWESDLGYPGSRGWYDWPNGQCNYAGGTYYNDDGQLPAGDSFQEFDVNPRSCGAHRDAVRIVVDMDSGQVWYSPDHYSDFYEIV